MNQLMELLPLPTDETSIRNYALQAIASRRPELEKVALENAHGDVPKLMGNFVKTYIRNFQCLSFFKERYGTAAVDNLRGEFESMPFGMKMHYMGVKIVQVPGIGLRKASNFLLIQGDNIWDSVLGVPRNAQILDWVEALAACEFGGSMLAAAYNRGTCLDVALTGELNAILLEDSDGWSSKVHQMLWIRDEVVKSGFPKLPCFSHGPYSNSIGSPTPYLRKFADKHWPEKQRQ